MSENHTEAKPEYPVRRPASERMNEGVTSAHTAAYPQAQEAAGQSSGQSAQGQGQSAQAPAQQASSAPREAADKRAVGIRRIHMTIARIDPLSALKLGFLISVAIGIMVVVAMALLWFVLDGMHVFSQIESLLQTLNSDSLLQLAQYLQFGRWMSFAVIVAIVDIVLLTALSAIGAFVYNLVAALVGGMRITVTDE